MGIEEFKLGHRAISLEGAPIGSWGGIYLFFDLNKWRELFRKCCHLRVKTRIFGEHHYMSLHEY